MEHEAEHDAYIIYRATHPFIPYDLNSHPHFLRRSRASEAPAQSVHNKPTRYPIFKPPDATSQVLLTDIQTQYLINQVPSLPQMAQN
jgi:hypothetical protein